LRRDLEAMASNRRANLGHLTSIDARIRVVESKMLLALHWEERHAQGKSMEEATALRLLEGQSSPAQENEPQS